MKAVVVTRAESTQGPLSQHLHAMGLPVLHWPTVQHESVDSDELTVALNNLERFDWIIFASRFAVAAVSEKVPKLPLATRVAAVGRATAQVLQQRGWSVDLFPDEFNADALVTAMAPHIKSGTQVLYPASSRALPTLAVGLKQLGADVLQVRAYDTAAVSLDLAVCLQCIKEKAVAVVTFTSPSAVQELAQALGSEAMRELFDTAAAVVIGPTTAQAVSRLGYPTVTAQTATLESLAAAVKQHYGAI
jgi:uroporphyrinogen-III synthase